MVGKKGKIQIVDSTAEGKVIFIHERERARISGALERSSACTRSRLQPGASSGRKLAQPSKEERRAQLTTKRKAANARGLRVWRAGPSTARQGRKEVFGGIPNACLNSKRPLASLFFSDAVLRTIP